MKRLIVLVAIMMTMVLSASCATMRPNNRPAEVTPTEYIEKGYRPAANILLVNERQATNVDWYLYEGRHSDYELTPNVEGERRVLGGYIDHSWLMNAINYQSPTIQKRKMDVGTCFTLLEVIHWGGAGDWGVYAYPFCTTNYGDTMPYRDQRGRQYWANVVITMPGSDTPAVQNLNLHITLHPNNAVRGFINGLMGR